MRINTEQPVDTPTPCKHTGKEYFYVTNSFAAPFFSDTDTGFVQGSTPREAMEKLIREYKHPCGLFAANLYESSDAYHKGKGSILKYVCNQEIEKARLTKGMGAYTYLGVSEGVFEIDHVRHTVKNPRQGRILTPQEWKDIAGK